MTDLPAWAVEKALALDLRWSNDTEWFDIIARALVAERAAERERCAKIAEGFHERAVEWAKTVRGLEKLIDETDSSRIAAAIRNQEEG